MKDFVCYPLFENQKSFLANYTPASEGFTTTKEMKLIVTKLGLDELTDAEILRSIRNSVVELYRELESAELIYNENGEWQGRTPHYWELHEGMMSVTAVIDNIMFKLNPNSML